MALWQEGITKVIMEDKHGTKLFDKKQQEKFDLFIQQTGLSVTKIKPNLEWVTKAFGVL